MTTLPTQTQTQTQNQGLAPASAGANPSERDNQSLAALKLALPKGRLQESILQLLGDAGVDVVLGGRAYRPSVSLVNTEAKLLKPQNVVEMLDAGARDVGFAGADWALEKNAPLVELLDTGLNPVQIVAAAPRELLTEDGQLPQRGLGGRQLVVASEYAELAQRWIERTGLDATVLRTYGATEVFPPEDADLIVDNTSTGSTLRANGLVIIDEVLRSSTRLFASQAAAADPAKRSRLDELVMLLVSVLDARSRVMLELNVSAADLDGVLDILPCMRQPTISSLRGEAGFAVRAAIPRSEIAALVPRLKELGGADLCISNVSQLVS
ncbi:MAG: ATP phosphoribosyltransferase [Paracoccaceae bacterium]